MIQSNVSKSLALIGVALLGGAMTGCSSFQAESEPITQTPAQAEAVQFTGLVAYDTQGLSAFSLVSADHIGFVAFGDAIVAATLPGTPDNEGLAIVEED